MSTWTPAASDSPRAEVNDGRPTKALRHAAQDGASASVRAVAAAQAPNKPIASGMSTDRASLTVPPRRALATVWFVAAVASAVLLVVAGRLEGGRDDVDQAEQRVGFLDEGPLPIAAPPVASGLPASGGATVVLFLRPGDAAQECREVSRSVASSAAVVAVLSVSAPCAEVAGVLVDPEGRTAAAYGMRVPADGGPPVGYAVVDGRAKVRYRTLDPHPAAHSGEIMTVLDAL